MKNRYVLLADLPLIAIAAFGAFAARFDWRFYETRPEFPLYLLAALVIKPATFLLVGMYRRYWRYASIQELLTVVIGVTASSVGMALFVLVASALSFISSGFSRVVFMSDWVLTLATAGGFRLAIRVAHESNFRGGGDRRDALRRILIVGAGAAGTMVAREMRRNPQLGMEPAGFLDDDQGKVGKRIAGLPVFGSTRELPEIVRARSIDSVIIAMPSARGPAVRAILELCQQVNVKSQTVPGMFELLDGQVSVNRLRNVDIADLLRRAPVDADVNAAGFVAGRVILITGGGGSIGSELARQIANAGPSHLVLLGHGENSIFEAEAMLRTAFPRVHVSSVIADIRDERRLTRILDRIRPAIIFHAAAHKHVPLMEDNPEEAVTNNILGTRNVVQQALRTDVERFVLISTDKAVSPTSIMGATKRIAEAVVRQAAAQSGRAFVAVRFGNVLGSRGSVVNTFKAQIARGGPVTVTHPDMTRYFMTIPEAVHLVLQASSKGTGGELFVLEMGEPVRIVQLAQDLIKLSGLSEDDIPIVFTNVRRGEKLEEILCDTEMQTTTSHRQVLQVIGPEPCVGRHLDRMVAELEDAARRGDRAAIEDLLGQAIPGFASEGRRDMSVATEQH
jgi:FlaA1/EpsC-like NDP-sugar epimerase